MSGADAPDGLSYRPVWFPGYDAGVVKCEECVKRFGPGGNGSCPVGRTLQAERAERGLIECLFFKGREVIASAKKPGRKDAPQEGLF